MSVPNVGTTPDLRQSALLEGGCEELPAGSVSDVLESLTRLVRAGLEEKGASFSGIFSGGTPSRLVVRIDGLLPETAAREELVTGPPVSAAGGWPSDPSPAVRGFARAQNASPEELEVVETSRGRYLALRKRLPSLPVFEILPAIFQGALSSLTFAKSMRWGRGNGPFLRPLLWLLALYRDEVVGFEFAGQVSGRLTSPPRYRGSAPVLVRNVVHYDTEVREWGVELSIARRRDRIENDLILAMRMEESSGTWPDDLTLSLDPQLLDEVTCLVENYRVVPATLPERFSGIPAPVVRTVLKVHQRFFVADSGSGRPVAHFLGVSGNPAAELSVVRDGYVRVVAARLEDAAYYINRDVALPLSDRVPGLDSVVFFPGVGSVGDKVRATRRLLFEVLALLPDGLFARHHTTREDLAAICEKAATLYKADLLTGLVKEFPELEGEVGRYYFLREVEKGGATTPFDRAVAQAIASHYAPRTFRDPVPEDLPSLLLSLCDRAVGQAGAFLGGANPSGSLDPFALRRSGLGLVRILAEGALPLTLSKLAELSLEAWALSSPPKPLGETSQGLVAFWEDRMESLFTRDGASAWYGAARLSDEPPFLSWRRLEFLSEFLLNSDFEAFETVKTRVDRILSGEPSSFDPALIAVSEERALWESLVALGKTPFPHDPTREDFFSEVLRLKPLLPVIESFFSAVLVNDPDPRVRSNRQALLAILAGRLSVFGHLDRLVSLSRKERDNG